MEQHYGVIAQLNNSGGDMYHSGNHNAAIIMYKRALLATNSLVTQNKMNILSLHTSREKNIEGK